MCREPECAERQDKDMRHETMVRSVPKQWKANPPANRGAHAFRQVSQVPQNPAKQKPSPGLISGLDLGV